jgi:predicted nucleic acid-binding protein
VNTILLDTNVVSYLMNGHSIARRFFPYLAGKTLTISFMTVAEMFEGAARAAWGPIRIQQLEQVLQSYLVIGSSPRICRAWGDVRSMRRQRPISAQDAWIAATALVRAVPLATNDVPGFSGIAGLQILAPV